MVNLNYIPCGDGDGLGTLEPTRVHRGPGFSCGEHAPARGSLKQETSPVRCGYGFMRPYHTSPRG